MMLQQTQVATVIPYFERWMQRFPSLESLARAEEADVLTYWSGLGYYSRARNVLRAAKVMAVMPEMPVTKEAWLEIPGVGPYTAGAIVSIALGQPEPILDGNVERVLSRAYRVDRSRGDAEFKNQLWAHARGWVTTAYAAGISPSALNQGMMELGALICTARNPKCLLCPIRTQCAAFATGTVDQYPPRRARPKFKQVREQVECFVRGDSVFLRQRSADEWCSGLWDFPLVASARELEKSAPHINYVVTNHKIRRDLIVHQEKSPLRPREGEWVKLAKILERPVGSALRKSLRKLSLLS